MIGVDGRGDIRIRCLDNDTTDDPALYIFGGCNYRFNYDPLLEILLVILVCCTQREDA